jgi:hypothetical protein
MNLSRRRIAARAASRFVPLDFGEQPHRKNHEKSEESDDILNAIVAKDVLRPNGSVNRGEGAHLIAECRISDPQAFDLFRKTCHARHQQF